MEIPRFAIGTFDPRIAGSEPGDAFQVFAGEVLRQRYPQLHAYRAHGRDGGIDLDTPTQVVVECKHCDGREARSAWNEVADRLDRHLIDPTGPGQSQYGPWYAAGNDAITGYVFATDTDLANKNLKSDLRDTIRGFFERIGERPHLAHLRRIGVEVLDWNDFEAELKARPELVFRWFPSTRPSGLTPLDEAPPGRHFRAFLSEATLPYYSRAAHLAASGGVAALTPPEDDLLAKLDSATGLIITGKGGVGKTRLTLQLGRRAKEKGWLVLQASATFREEALDELLARFVQPTDVLLLIDYVEMVAAFADRIEHIEALNATLPHRVRYIANCRTSYYRTVQTIPGHECVDMTPAAGESSSWLETYRRAIVERVLSASGIETTPAYLKVCRDVPVFAVFMAYLQRQKRTDDLHALVTDGEFGSWIARRIQQSFGRPIATDLTMLLAAFPMGETRRRALSPAMRELFERMAADGWIEQLTAGPDAGQWVTAHDALADRVILNHIESLGGALGPFVEDLLDFAEANDGVASVLIALQRLADTEPLQSLQWVDIFAGRLNRRGPAWLAARTQILQNSLLPETERITLLERTGNCWDDLTADPTFQSALGWICKHFADAKAPAQQQIDVLRAWVLRSAVEINQGNYLLTRGLILFPELRATAERWLAAHPSEFQTHYLLVAWLNGKHGTDVVEKYVAAWLNKFAAVAHCSFVFEAWLDSEGGRAIVEEPIRRWLEHHAESEATTFVYRAWLEATSDRALVEAPIRQWLEHHAESEAATFVYRAWLEATSDRALVEAPIRRWLGHHAESEAANFVYRAWLEATSDRALVEEPIRRWLEHHAESEAAQFVYRAWLDATSDRALVEEPIRQWLVHHAESEAAQFVYSAWLNAGGALEVVESQLIAWVARHADSPAADFVITAYLKRTRAFEPVRQAALACMARMREDPEGSFVSKVLAPQADLPDESVLDILAWCRHFFEDPDALWRLSQMREKIARPSVAAEACAVVELVLGPWLEPSSSPDHAVANNVAHVLSALTAVHEPQLGQRIDAMLLRWLRHPRGLDVSDWCRFGGVRRLARRVNELLDRGLVDLARDDAALQRFARWVERCDTTIPPLFVMPNRAQSPNDSA